MKLIISPYAARLMGSGKPSPKSYPYWPKLVELLTKDGYDITQVGVTGEQRIDGIGQFITNFPFSKLRELVNDSDGWISVDNFWPHFIACERLKRGIVLWGQSDPRIFGYPGNINLLRSRDYLRQWQYQNWAEVPMRPEAFVYAENVIPHVYKLAPPVLSAKTSIGSYATSRTIPTN